MYRKLKLIHLCIVFVVILWTVSYPFLQELFYYKSQLLVYEFVMGHEKLERNRQKFTDLSIEKKEFILKNYENLKHQMNRPWFSKVKISCQLLMLELPSFKRLWIAISLAICFLYLSNESKAVVWLLPLIAICYAFQNHYYGITPTSTDSVFFPSEKRLLVEYVKEPLHAEILEQKKQLIRGWHLYLIHEWAKAIPSQDPIKFQNQIESGEFSFHLTRLEKMGNPKIDYSSVFSQKESPWLLLMYVGWNLFFAVLQGDDFFRIQSAADSPNRSSSSALA